MSNEKIYSVDDETYDFDEIEYVIDFAIDGAGSIKKGDILTVYEGERHKFKASDFFAGLECMIEGMSELAYEAVGEEAADDWPDIKDEKIVTDLRVGINKAINIWASKNNLEPRFFCAKDIKEIKVKILSDDGSEYEIIKDDGENHE